MFSSKKLFNMDPYSLRTEKKNYFFRNIINDLNKHHYNNSKNYQKLLNFFNFKLKKKYNLQDAPFLPVRIFKELDLLSIKSDSIVKILNSSGTSNKKLSKIYLDKENSKSQARALNTIMQKLLGKKRLPMLIVDKKNSSQNRQTLNARSAAINGFSLFGKNHLFLLTEDNSIDYESLNFFLNKYKNQKFLIFGFTSLIFEILIKKIKKENVKHSLENAILLHGGGWKKMEQIKVSNLQFKKLLNKNLNISNIRNYYGLVEQTGSIFIECPCGYFITTIFSEIIIRDKNFNVQKNGKRGFIQLLSSLPTSYPGHNILTEDIGEIVNKNKCKCLVNGTRFLVHGRVEEAEVRGCSDV